MYDKHMTNVCVRLFLENWEKYTMGFMSEFQKLTVSDEKVIDTSLNFAAALTWTTLACKCQFTCSFVYLFNILLKSTLCVQP